MNGEIIRSLQCCLLSLVFQKVLSLVTKRFGLLKKQEQRGTDFNRNKFHHLPRSHGQIGCQQMQLKIRSAEPTREHLYNAAVTPVSTRINRYRYALSNTFIPFYLTLYR